MPDGGKNYKIVKGDWLNKIARSHGLASWKDIYYHPKNAGFRKLRPDPNSICPGDEVWVPEIALKGHKTGTGKKPIGVKKLTANLEVVVTDKTDAKAVGDVSVWIQAPEFIKGVTDGSGKARFEGVARGEFMITLVHRKYFPQFAVTEVKAAPDKIVENTLEIKLQRYPHFESKTTGNKISIVFDPDCSEKIKKCKKIVHVQFVRKHVNGKVVKPGSYLSRWKFRDKITTSAGWGVDCLASEVTPDYQQGVGNGKKNGGSDKAEITDAPKTGGGDKGFYSAATNPNGCKTYRNEFVTFAWCMDGNQCGTWYEGIRWEYRKTDADHKAGKVGKSVILDYNVAAPSKSHLEAFKKFNKEKGFVPCK